MTPALFHVTLPGPRSLCGLPYPTDAEVGAQRAVCASCLLLLSRLRREAAALVQVVPNVAPVPPSAAWAALRETDWAQHVDLEEFLARADLDKTIDVFAFRQEVDPESVNALVEQWRAQEEATRSHETKIAIAATTRATCSGCDWTVEGDDTDVVVAAARAHVDQTRSV